MDRSEIDWSAIKTEYITDESSSYRKLAQKYGVSYTSIGAKARQEGWAEDRERFINETLSKTVKIIEKDRVKRLTRIHSITDKALDKLEHALDNIDPLDTQGFRQIIASIKDIKEIQMLKSETDLREQEARIRNLEKQAEAEEQSNDIRVTIEGDLEVYSK